MTPKNLENKIQLFLKLLKKEFTNFTTMSSTKFEIEKFSSKYSLELWKLKMWDLLLQQGLQKYLDGKGKRPLTMIDDE